MVHILFCALFVCIVGSIYFPLFCGWTIFFWPAIIWYFSILDWNAKNLFVSAIWGAFLYTGQLSGILLGIMYFAGGPIYIAFLIPLIPVILIGALQGFTYFLAIQLCPFCTISKRYIWAALITYFYFLWIERYGLIFLGKYAGFSFCNPLVSLMVYKWAHIVLSMLGSQWFFVIVLGWNVLLGISLYHIYVHNNYFLLMRTICVALLGISCIMIVVHYYKEESPPLWLTTIGTMKLAIPAHIDRNETIRQIVRNMHKLWETYPQIHCFFCPESACYRTDLFPLRIDEEKLLPSSIHLIIGGFRREKESIYNTLWWLSGGKCVTFLDKQKPLLMTERLPKLLNRKWLEKLYFHNSPQIAIPMAQPRPLWMCAAAKSFVPIICSEFFCSEDTDLLCSQDILLVVCNTRWALPVVKQLLARVVQYRALRDQSDILYIADAESAFFSKSGVSWSIQGSEL